MSKSLWVVFVALFAIGCAPGHVDLPATMSVSPDFSPEEAEAIFVAADAWSAATNGAVRLNASIGGDAGIHVTPFDSEQAWLGDTRIFASDSANIKIDTAYIYETAGYRQTYEHVSAQQALQDAVMHELGHAFGLGHVEGGLMRSVGYGGAEIDEDTRSRFCSAFSCN